MPDNCVELKAERRPQKRGTSKVNGVRKGHEWAYFFLLMIVMIV
jgi:hypothetical protein